jgi:hypothetical protein
MKFFIDVITKKHLDEVFHSNNHNSFEKKGLLKNYFHFKNIKNDVGGLCIKIHFTCLLIAR